MKDFYADFKLGVLGGGQLGRMLIQQGINYNISFHVMDPDAEAPCAKLCEEFTQASLQNFEAVYKFGKQVDLLTIEFEHINVEALERLESEGLAVYPQSRVLKLVQDKGLQKQFYKLHNIPSADFKLINNKAELSHYKDFLPCFQKLRKNGYDGKGVQALKNESDFDNAFEEPSIIEKLVPFSKELAVIVSRNKSGQMQSFPVVEMEFNQQANLVEFLLAPARISAEVAEKAQKLAKLVAEKLDIVGILAVEMFLTSEGEILVNEIAPRPHNSGHHTIEANMSSQYDQHLRSILNLPLGSTSSKMPAVMLNLLGEQNYQGLAKYEGLEKAMALDGVFIHLYGKKQTKSFRKMGHVTVLAPEADEAIALAKEVKNILKVKA